MRFAVLYCRSDTLAFAQFGGKAATCRLLDLRLETGNFEAPADFVAGIRRLRLPRAARRGLTVVPGDLAILSKVLRPPQSENGGPQEAIGAEVARSMPFPIEEVIWDHMACGDRESGDARLVVASRWGPVDALCAILDEAGLMPGAVAVVPVLEANLIRSSAQCPAEPFIMVHLAGAGMHCVYVDGEPLAFRSIQVGDDGRTPTDLARRLARDLPRWLATLRGTGRQAAARRLILTGSGGEPFAGALERALEMEVECFDILGASSVESPLPLDVLRRHRALLTSLVGAARSASLAPDCRIDLLPAIYRERLTVRRRQPRVLAVTTLAVLGGAACWSAAVDDLRQAEAARDQLQLMMAPVASIAAAMNQERAVIAEVDAQVRIARQLGFSRRHWMRLLSDLQERLTRVENVWIDTLTPREDACLRLTGRMLDPENPLERVSADMRGRVQRLLNELAGSEWVASVSDERFDTSERGVLRFSFVLTMESGGAL